MAGNLQLRRRSPLDEIDGFGTGNRTLFLIRRLVREVQGRLQSNWHANSISAIFWRGLLGGVAPLRRTAFRYSVYSVKGRFRRKFKNSVVPYGQDGRSGRICSLFTKYAQIPKLEGVGSNPISRFYFNILRATLSINLRENGVTTEFRICKCIINKGL